MTYTVDLDGSIDAIIAQRANQRGVTVSEYLKLLAEKDVRQDEEKTTFGQRWISVFGDRPAGDGAGNWSEVEAACDPD